VRSRIARPPRRLLLTVLFPVVFLLACFWVGRSIGVLPQGYKAAPALAFGVVVAVVAGPFGLLSLVVAAAPFEWDVLNLTNLPLVGTLFPGNSLKLQLVIAIGGAYLLLLVAHRSTESKSRAPALRRAHVAPTVPLLLTLAGGALSANVFATFAGPSEVTEFVRNVLFGAVVFLLVRALADTRDRIERLMACVVVAGVAFAVVSSVLPSSVVAFQNAGSGWDLAGRLGGVWTLPLGVRIVGNPVYISSYLAISVVIALGQFLVLGRQARRWYWFAAAAPVGYALLATVSRTGVYGTIAGLLVAGMFTWYQARTRVTLTSPGGGASAETQPGASRGGLIVAGALVVMAIAAGFRLFLGTLQNPGFVMDRLFHPVAGPEATIGTRLLLAGVSLTNSLRNPGGPGVLALHSTTGYNEHSLYTLMLAGCGWVGFAGFVWLLLWCIGRATRLGLRGSEASARQAAVIAGAIACVMWMGLAHPILGTLWGDTLLWGVLGLAAALPAAQSLDSPGLRGEAGDG
jgi:hypothetical protein